MRRKWRLPILFLIFLNSFILFGEETKKKSSIDPGNFLEKADKAVKIEPDKSMDLAKTVLEYLRIDEDKFLEFKAKIIIGKALFYKGDYNDSLKILQNVKANIVTYKLEIIGIPVSQLCSEALFFLGNVYLKLNRYKKSVENYKMALSYLKGTEETAIKTKILVELARTHLMLSEYQKALSYAYKGLKSSEKTGDTDSLFYTHYFIGYIFREIKEYEKALINFRKAKNIAETSKNVNHKIMAMNEISNVFYFQNKLEESLKLKTEALELSKQVNDIKGMAYCMNDIALILVDKKEYKRALSYFYKALKIEKELNNMKGIVISSINIAKTCFLNGEIKKAKINAKKTLKLAEDHNLESESLKLTELLSMISIKENNYKNALEYLNDSYRIHKKIFSTEKVKKIAELEAEIEVEKNTNRILLLEKVNRIKQLELDKTNRSISMLKLTAFALLIIIYLIFMAYRVKKKSNLELKEVNLKLDSLNKNLKKKGKELEKTLTEVHKLSGLLPICSSCKKIRDDTGYWHQVEEYIKSHSEVSFSHSLCPVCVKKIYPENSKKNKKKKKTTEK